MKYKQIKIGAILSYISLAINVIAGLVYTPWMVEQIGDENYGLYTLANSLITLFLVDFGLGAAVNRYVSKYRAEGRQDKINNFLGAIYKLYLVIDAVIFLALLVTYFLIDTIYAQLSPSELHSFKTVYIISASFAVVNFPFVTLNGILNAYEKFIQLKLADIIYRVLLIGVTIAALLFDYNTEHKLVALVAIHAAVGLIVTIYKFAVVQKQLPIQINFRHHEAELYKDIFGFSFWIMLAALAQRLIFNITPTILGATVTGDASFSIAVFGIITMIEGYAYTITTAINGMFMPRISRVYEGENAERNLAPLFVGVGKFQYALNGLIIAGFAVVGKEFIALWMGPEYIDAYFGILLVTIPGLFFNSLQIANTAMTVRKIVKIPACINIGTGLCNVVLSIWLSSMLGVLGACLSIFVAYMLRALATNIVVWRELKFDIPAFVMQCYIRLSIPILLCIAVGFVLNAQFSSVSWMSLVMKAAIVAVVYLALILIIGLNKEERMAVRAIIKKKIKKRN